jgi:serine/threonine-protein kinase
MSSVGQAAVERGFITGAQLQEAMAIQERVLLDGLNESLEEIFLKKGWLTPDQLAEIQAAIGQSAQQIFPGYDILEKLGAGGMGSVFKARRKGDDRLVAIKTLSTTYSATDDAVDRFLREANLLRRIQHDNLVAGLDAGYHRGLYYYVMELVEGPSLAKLIERGPMPWKDALRIIRQVAQGLQCAADQGIVHRDVKPANIMIAANGIAKVADLGIARFSDARHRASVTTSSVIIGTPHFMSPEQAEGLPDVDHRSDIYSLGLTLFAAITGNPPFQDDIPLRMMERRITEDVPIQALVPFGTPENLRALVRKMCARSRIDRYAGWTELLRDLMDVEQGRAVEVSSRSAPVDPSAGMLGRLAIDEGYISPAQLEAAMKVQESIAKSGTRKLLGNILVEEGFIRAADLKKLLSLHSFHVRHAQDKALGEQIVKSGLVSSAVITEALREQKERFQREGFSPTLEQILYQRGSITETQLRTVLRMSRRMNASATDVMSGLKECPRCVEMIPVDSTRCPRCRATLLERPAAPAPAPASEKLCPVCGTPHDGSSKRCKNCDIVFETGKREMTQKLTTCPACKKLVSDYQTKCTHCNAELRTTAIQKILKSAKGLGQHFQWLYVVGAVVLVILLFNSTSLRNAWIKAVGGEEGQARLVVESFLDACTHSDASGVRQHLLSPPSTLPSKDDIRYYGHRMAHLPDGSYSLYRFDVERSTVSGDAATVYLKLVFVNDSNPKDFYTTGGTMYLSRAEGGWKIKF